MKSQRVCVVGSVNIDSTYTVRAIPSPGETMLAESRRVSHGGKGANQSAASAASGASVAFVSAVGDDEDGAAALAELRSRGIDVEGVACDKFRPTGNAVIVVGRDGENVIVVDPGANAALDPAWTAEHVRHDAAVLLGQLEIPLSCLAAAAEAAPDAVFVLNPAPMPADPSTLDGLLAMADVLVPNRRELGQIVARPEPRTIADVDDCAKVLAFAGTLIVTLGAEGAAIYEAGRLIARVPAADVRAIDTSGAGDAFCGGLAHGLAIGDSMEVAVRQATELAGRCTTQPGARLPMEVRGPVER